VIRALKVWVRARRIARIRADRLEREWLEGRAAWERQMDVVEDYWWRHEWPRRIFGGRG
jgi:hypothetical protein